MADSLLVRDVDERTKQCIAGRARRQGRAISAEFGRVLAEQAARAHATLELRTRACEFKRRIEADRTDSAVLRKSGRRE